MMKLLGWFRTQTTQTKWMIGVIAMLLLMIATRWGYIAHTAGSAIRERFVPPTEQADSIDHTTTLPIDSLTTEAKK